MKRSIVREKSVTFALRIIKLYQFLTKNKEFVMSKQMLRSGTSIGANIAEALAAESRKDFIHKMSIASKEARETNYWLTLLKESQIVQYDYNQEVIMCEELVKMLTSIIKTSKNKL